MWKRVSIAVVIALIAALVIVPLAISKDGQGPAKGSNGICQANGNGFSPRACCQAGACPAFGKNFNPPAKARNRFVLIGRVVSPVAGDTLVVKVRCGTSPLRAARGKDLEVTIASDAKLFDRRTRPRTPAALNAFVAGSRVLVAGIIDRQVPSDPEFIAKRLVLLRLPVAR
jgi:hypothetical protein